MKGQFTAKGIPVGFGNLPQGLFRGLMFLVKSIPQTSDMARLNPQATDDLFQGTVIVNVVHEVSLGQAPALAFKVSPER